MPSLKFVLLCLCFGVTCTWPVSPECQSVSSNDIDCPITYEKPFFYHLRGGKWELLYAVTFENVIKTGHGLHQKTGRSTKIFHCVGLKFLLPNFSVNICVFFCYHSSVRSWVTVTNCISGCPMDFASGRSSWQPSSQCSPCGYVYSLQNAFKIWL